MEQFTQFQTIALVTLGTIVLLVMFIRGPRPDPKLAAEPLSVTARNAVLWFGYYAFLRLAAGVLPREVVFPAIIAIAVAAIAATAWWRRRHPPTARDGTGAETIVASPPAEVVAASTGEWVRALVPVVVIGGVVFVLVAFASKFASPM